MYLRIAIASVDAGSHQPQGIFYAAWHLLNSGELTNDEAADLRSLLEWFNENMPSPGPAIRRNLSERAIFWFHPTAHDLIARAWELVQLLRLHGLLVEVLKTRDPGSIVYSDRCQIAAVPNKNTF